MYPHPYLNQLLSFNRTRYSIKAPDSDVATVMQPIEFAARNGGALVRTSLAQSAQRRRDEAPSGPVSISLRSYRRYEGIRVSRGNWSACVLRLAVDRS